MIWKLLVGYVVLTQIIFFCWTWFSRNAECGGDEQPIEERYNLVPWHARMCYCISGALMFVCAPIAVPIMVVVLIRWIVREQRAAKELLNTHRELLLDPLHESNIPAALAEFLDEHTPRAVAEGFDPLGDFWLKGEPVNSKARLFFDGRAFFELGIVWDVLYFECNSFLDDGSMIATARCAVIKSHQKLAEAGVHVQALPDADLSEIVMAHRARLDKMTDETGIPVHTICESRWQEYYRYHNRKFALARYETGDMDNPPAECEFPGEKSTDQPQIVSV